MNFKGGQKSEGSGSGLPFLRIRAGETVTGLFAGEPFEFYQVWETKSISPLDLPKPPGAAYRFRINFIVKEGASYVAKVWEQGSAVSQQIQDIDETIKGISGGEQSLAKKVVTISRFGSGKDDTKYKISVAKNQPNERSFEILKSVKLNELAPQGMPKPKASDEYRAESFFDEEPPPEVFQDEIPF